MGKSTDVLTVPEILDLLGGNIPAAKICGFKANHSSRGADMRRRNQIQVIHWPPILAHAKKHGIKQITPVSLIEANVGYKLNI